MSANELKQDPTARSHSKFTQNILLGKFLQRDNLEKVQYLFTKEELDHIYGNPSNDIKMLQLIDHDILKVVFEKKKAMSKLSTKNNFFIGNNIKARYKKRFTMSVHF